MDTPDVIDRMMAAWKEARPELDPTPLGLVGRVIVLAQPLERSVEEALEKHHLTLGQFDILATLRRNGPKGGLAASALLEGVILSSGGMPARLDSLCRDGWIYRKTDPKDRRKVVVELTAKGRRTIDAATRTRFAEAAESQPPLTPRQRAKLAEMLRRWLAQVAG